MTAETITKGKISLPVDENHVFFFIQNEVLYETYNTIRGRRKRMWMPLPGLPDMDNVTEDQLNMMCSSYLVQCDNCTSFYVPADRNNEPGKPFRFEPNLCYDCICKSQNK